MSPMVNLIPADRRAARRRQHRIARWTTGCTAYAIVLVTVYGLCLVRWGDAGHETFRRLDEVRGATRDAGQRMAELRGRLGEALRQLRADRLITQRPDWSILLTRITALLDDEVVLQSCRIAAPGPATSGVPGDGSGSRAPHTLFLRGMATAPLAVSQLALRLEELALFSRVAVEETHRESFDERKVVGFSITCVIEDGAES